MNIQIYGNKVEGNRAHGTSDESDELLPCPFCGSGEIIVENTHTPCYQAECQGCGAQGPKSDSVKRHATTYNAVMKQHHKAFDQAVRYWNNREIVSA